MGLRIRNQHWHYKFRAAGRVWTGDTGLVATARNRNAALRKEADTYKLVTEGRGDQRKLTIKTFSDAADQFIEWTKGEYRAKPNTWKRLGGSVTSLKVFFGNLPLHSLTSGQLLDYMSWRRVGDPKAEIPPVKEITLRHDLHALSLLFQYGVKHNWCARNPVEEVEIPSDKDAQRIHVVSAAEEMRYFRACISLEQEYIGKSQKTKRNGSYLRAARAFRALHDLGRIMLLQGARPTEVMQVHASQVDLEFGRWSIPESKSDAGRRTLKLVPEALSILATRISQTEASGWLFRGKSPSTPMKTVEHAHQKILKRTGFRFVLYDFRHTCATRWAERGMGIETIARLLGHANLRTVMRYVHLSQEHLDRSMLLYGTEQDAERVQSGSTDSAIFGDSSLLGVSERKLQ